MDPQKISELAKLLRNNGDKILSCEFTLTLSGTLLRALNDAFTLIADSLEVGEVQNFQVVKPMNSKPPVFRDLQLIHDFVQKTALLCLVDYPGDDYYGIIDISKFRALKRLELKKIDINQVVGIQRLRGQLQHVICVKSIKAVDEIITNCGGDKSNGFVWNELKIADFSYNNLKRVDTSLEFAQYLQHLNLRHNQLQSVEAVKWLPNLKSLDVSFNRLTQIPQFHMDANKRLQSLNMSNNLLDEIRAIVKLDALTDLDVSDNCLLDHTYLLPLRALMTLKFLNLYGNPLHCHPKHRLATAKYLHKNCSTVQFVLDFDTLSKSEKAATGAVKLRPMGPTVNQYTISSSPSSISASSRRSASTATPCSSVGSLVSFTLPVDNSSDSSDYNNTDDIVRKKKMSSKTRCVEIEDHPEVEDAENAQNDAAEDVMHSSITSAAQDTEHLETKRQIVELREKYGNEWLHTGNAEMEQSFMGNQASSIDLDLERQKSREIFKEFIKDVAVDTVNSSNTTIRTSTPANITLDNTLDQTVGSPIKKHNQTKNIDSTLYKSLDQSQTLINNSSTKIDTENTLYISLDDSKKVHNNNPFEDQQSIPKVDKELEPATSKNEQETIVEEEMCDHLKYVYSSTENEEDEFSEREDDEQTYIVYKSNHNEAIFLTKSSNFLRERDPLTEKTKSKWSLKILESCDRIKSNTLRINFDTVKADKQERVYTVEEDLCQELEKGLRDILSQRDLSEMNQAIYRCVNCNCQFSQEIKNKNPQLEIRCTNCNSSFVAEIHDIPKSLEKAVNLTEKLSPASIVEELLPPLNANDSGVVETAGDNNSIGKGNIRLSAINPLQQTTTTTATTLKQIIKRSATSLNESSSCSKITTNSDSSFNSNQSLVGSSNTDRDLDFKTNGESDIDIISNPSQSSIEVLEQFSSRKTSEERRISHIPNLETIDDQSYTQTFLEKEFDNMITYAKKDKPEDYLETEQAQPQAVQQQQQQQEEKTSAKSSYAQNILTESSSSGSVTDSVCTAYEQRDGGGVASKPEIKSVTKDFLQKEKNDNVTSKTTSKKEEGNGALTSMFGALMQSTNILMSSSKKLIDSETFSNVKSGSVIQPTTTAATSNTKSTATTTNSSSSLHLYKFNYIDFNDVDHRLKLYFYQTKFEEKEEHFKWIVKGRIYVESTKELSEGCIVVSTCKLYVMEAFAEENDDVSKWLRPIISCTVDRLDTIQLLPWKMGLSFYLKGWGGFLLLLQDILRTDSLMLFFLNNALPSSCELKYQPNEVLIKRLNSSVIDEQLNMCSILNGCEISCENAKRSFSICCLLTTDSRLYLSSQKLGWLSDAASNDQQQHPENGAAAEGGEDIELCVTQFMSNLVEVEHCSDSVFIINFLDETQDKCELWKCTFETAENASTCLNAIAQSWEKLFGVPLINA